MNRDGEEFGIERLQDEFKKSRLEDDSLEDTINKILRAVDDFSVDPSNHIDDQTMVIIQHV
jgi:serine phosphatase RsbU (regulator of sigma subunit)